MQKSFFYFICRAYIAKRLERRIALDQPSTISRAIFEIMDTCLLAGKIMLQSGAETYRVEDTMIRIAETLGIPGSHSYVTPTVIMFSTNGTDPAKLIRIAERTTDLHKIAQVNLVSRRISSGELNVNEAYELLKVIEAAPSEYSVRLRIIAAAIASGCFSIMFQGSWSDFLPAIVAGGVGYAASLYLHRWVQVKFFAELSAAFLIGLLAAIFINLGWGDQLDKIIIGSIMPLVPGLLITNAIRDLMAGHLVSGISKGADALLTAFATGSGVAIVLTFIY